MAKKTSIYNAAFVRYVVTMLSPTLAQSEVRCHCSAIIRECTLTKAKQKA